MPRIISGYQNNHLFGKGPFASAAWDSSSQSGGKYTGYNTSDTNLNSGSHKILYRNPYGMLNTSTGIVTVPISGLYVVTGQYADGTGTADTRHLGHLWVNNTYYGEWHEGDEAFEDGTAVRIFQLNASDYLQFGHNVSFPYDGFGFEIAFIG